MIEKHPPKFCPECGGPNVTSVPLWKNSNWMAEPSDPDWVPFTGTSYDTWCEDCETSFDIAPGKEMDVCWFDKHPEQIPAGGNKRYSDILLQRDPPDERCGNCNRFFSGFVDVKGSEYVRMEIYCDLDGKTDVKYYRPCMYDPSAWREKVHSSGESTK